METVTWVDPSGAGEILCGECTEVLAQFADRSINLTVTSPPYFNIQKRYQRGKGHHYSKDVGEPLYVIVDCARALYPKTHENGFFCLNLGFSYAETGVMRPFNIADRILKMTPWKVVDVIIWRKSNPVPMTGRLTNAFEYVFVFSPTPLPKYPHFETHPKDYIHNIFESPVGQGVDGIPVFPPRAPPLVHRYLLQAW